MPTFQFSRLGQDPVTGKVYKFHQEKGDPANEDLVVWVNAPHERAVRLHASRAGMIIDTGGIQRISDRTFDDGVDAEVNEHGCLDPDRPRANVAIFVRGGVVQGVRTDHPNLHVEVVDADDIEADIDDAAEGEEPPDADERWAEVEESHPYVVW